MRNSVTAALLVSLASVTAQGVSAIISAPGTAPSGCALSQSGIFGIQIVTQSGAPSAAALEKRAVTQISDGQIQATSAVSAQPVTQITDGQIQATSAVAAVPVTQITDGQIQAATSTAAAAPVTQISDGQIQAPTSTAAASIVTVTVTKDNCVASPITQISDGQIQAPYATPVTQISDGQIQAPTAASAVPVTQISDGQIQATSAAKVATAVSQISDGQIQAATSSAKTGTAVAQITDGQIQATTLKTSTKTSSSAGMSTGTTAAGYAMLPGAAQACASAGTLQITLTNGVLHDAKNRTGYIAANSQFQFDDPPQTGAIYTAGWSVCSNGTLALGGNTTFYECLSGSFYNIYYKNILGAGQCTPVQIEAIQLNSC